MKWSSCTTNVNQWNLFLLFFFFCSLCVCTAYVLTTRLYFLHEKIKVQLYSMVSLYVPFVAFIVSFDMEKSLMRSPTIKYLAARRKNKQKKRLSENTGLLLEYKKQNNVKWKSWSVHFNSSSLMLISLWMLLSKFKKLVQKFIHFHFAWTPEFWSGEHFIVHWKISYVNLLRNIFITPLFRIFIIFTNNFCKEI